MALQLKGSSTLAAYPQIFTASHENILLIPSTNDITSTLNTVITTITTSQNDGAVPQYRLIWVYNEGPESLTNVQLNIVAQNMAGATTTLQFFNDRGLVSSNPNDTIKASYPGTVVDGWDSYAEIGNLPVGHAAGVWTKTVGNKDIAVSEDFITLQTSSEIA
jgi:hypothetical protein